MRDKSMFGAEVISLVSACVIDSVSARKYRKLEATWTPFRISRSLLGLIQRRWVARFARFAGKTL